MAKIEIERVALLDEPSEVDLFHGKGHERTAKALASAIRSFQNDDRAIGLDGPWGSGKSSVVGIAQQELLASNGKGKVNFHFFTFDIWKSQGSAFRRSFLEHLLAWSKETFPKKKTKLSEIDSKIKGKIREIDTDNQHILGWYGIAVLLAVPLIPIYVLWSKSTFDFLSQADKELSYLCSWPMIVVYMIFIATFFEAVRRFRSGEGVKDKGLSWWKQFQFALSRTLLIGAKQYEHQKVTQYVRETDPNDFEFQSVLREILTTIQDRQNKVVMVLDNIDRLPSEEIADYWALVRSIFSRNHSDLKATPDNQITAIVPYDRRLIEKSASRETESENQSPLRSRELFAKTFDEILFVAPPVMSNTREFFQQKIGQALPGINDKESLFRAYLVFNSMVEGVGGRSTPRQVISFINELTGIFALHQGKIGLPTVAVYLAVQDKLDRNPYELANPEFLTEQLRALASDPDLDKNLAAILFNVDPELAFQILLDGEIKSALNAEASSRLVELSGAPGFDERVNDVFTREAEELKSSERLAPVIKNLCELVSSYNGEATPQLKRSMMDAFFETHVINIGKDSSQYQELIAVCDPRERQSLTNHLVSTALKSAISSPSDQKKGALIARFLVSSKEAIEKIDSSVSVTRSLKDLKLPTNPSFIFGLASKLHRSSIPMSDFSKPTIDLPTDSTFLEEVAFENPEDSRAAFAEFHSLGIITDDNWVKVSNHLISEFQNELRENARFPDHLALLSEIVSYIGSQVRASVELASLFKSEQFIENLHHTYSDDLGAAGVADAVFLAATLYFDGKLSQPTGALPNGRVGPIAQEGFDWFIGLLQGELELTSAQLESIIAKILRTHLLYRWIRFGDANRDNRMIADVVRAVIHANAASWMPTKTLFQCYDYLKHVLAERFMDLVAAFSANSRKDDISKIGVEDIPPDMLNDTKEFADSRWLSLHERVNEILGGVTKEEWPQHFATYDKYADLLFSKISSSGYSPETTVIRDAFLRFFLGVLDRTIVPSSLVSNFDLLMNSIDQGFHPQFYKNVREEIRGTDTESITLASKMFLPLIAEVIKQGSKSKTEKENIVRYILCPALEGGVAPVVDLFLELGRRTVADYINSSEKSTQDAIGPALRIFCKEQDYDYAKRVTALIKGRKEMNFFDPTTWLQGREAD